MSIQDLFHIPNGEKVTDKAFYKVLVSSICSILFCMACLVGTTWAWFTADMTSTDNVIQIAAVTVDATVTHGDTAIDPVDGCYALPVGDCAVQMRIDNNATSARTVYVLVTVTQDGGDTLYYLPFANGATDATVRLSVEGSLATLRFTALWSQPAALPLGDTATLIGTDSTTTSTTTTSTTTTTDTTTTSTTDTITTTTTTDTTTTTSTTETESSDTTVPTAPEPTETEPTATEPTATEPTETEPTETEPTETEPTETESANE